MKPSFVDRVLKWVWTSIVALDVAFVLYDLWVHMFVGFVVQTVLLVVTLHYGIGSFYPSIVGIGDADRTNLPEPPRNVRIHLGSEIIPVDCRYVGVVADLHHWVVVTDYDKTRVTGIDADVLPARTSIGMDVEL